MQVRVGDRLLQLNGEELDKMTSRDGKHTLGLVIIDLGGVVGGFLFSAQVWGS